MTYVKTRRVGLVKTLNFFHDERGFGGFGVGDVDGEAFVFGNVVQFVGQHVGRQMQAAFGQVFFAVAKGGFYHQHAHVHVVHALPKGRVALGVARKYPARGIGLAVRNGIAHGGHGVHCRQGLYQFARNVQRLAGADGVKADEGGLGAWYAAKVWPNHVVKNMGLQAGNGLGQRMHTQRAGAGGRHRVHHQGQRRNVVQVRMGQQHVVNACHFCQRQVAHARACVYQQVAVQQKRRGSAVFGYGAGAA